MTAECTRTKLRFQGLDGRDVVGRFDGGEITSDAGGVLLREVEQRTRILGRLSECFTDYRDPDRVEHSVEALTKQRVLGLCLGYEDLNDHDELCRDRLLALLCDRDDLTGEFRRDSESGRRGQSLSFVLAGVTCSAKTYASSASSSQFTDFFSSLRLIIPLRQMSRARVISSGCLSVFLGPEACKTLDASP